MTNWPGWRCSSACPPRSGSRSTTPSGSSACGPSGPRRSATASGGDLLPLGGPVTFNLALAGAAAVQSIPGLTEISARAEAPQEREQFAEQATGPGQQVDVHDLAAQQLALAAERADLIFAVDSIPAAFAITQNPFLIYTSNIFAVMGLRAMFFLLAGIIDKFYLLQKGLSVILFFIGAKMLLDIWHVEVNVYLSFTVIIVTLTLSIVFSVLIPRKAKIPEGEEITE